MHLVKNQAKDSGVSVYVNESQKFKVRTAFSINSRDIESLSLEILFDKRYNTHYSMFYTGHVVISQNHGKLFKEYFY